MSAGIKVCWLRDAVRGGWYVYLLRVWKFKVKRLLVLALLANPFVLLYTTSGKEQVTLQYGLVRLGLGAIIVFRSLNYFG